MITRKIAFPSTLEGVHGNLSFHFGRTPAFSIIEYNAQTGEVVSVEIVKNVPHEKGNCLKPVQFLIGSDINELVVGNIGQNPLMGFLSANVDLFTGFDGTVKQNYEAFKQGTLKKLSVARPFNWGH